MLKHIGGVPLPNHIAGGFDHGDVHSRSGTVFVAHTANNAIEIVDGVSLRHLGTINGCQEASGVLCAQGADLVFAAARGAGKILMIDALKRETVNESTAGSKPNGLAWDARRKQLLVTDVEDFQARLLDTFARRVVAASRLLGRPRWCIYDKALDLYFVNIRDPAGVAVLVPETLAQKAFFPLSVAGPHGLDLDEKSGRAFVACDGKAVVLLDTGTGKEVAVIPIAGEPDAIWFNSRRARLYCAIGNPGVVDVIDTQTSTLVEEIRTEEGAHTLAFDGDRQRLYAFLPKTCRVSVYEEEPLSMKKTSR